MQLTVGAVQCGTFPFPGESEHDGRQELSGTHLERKAPGIMTCLMCPCAVVPQKLRVADR